jgi:diguanylate cyclase (GGDEF)-like protein
VAVRLLKLRKDPEFGIADLVEVIKDDPAITAKILKSANSTYFGLRWPVKSLEKATALLGTTVITTLALTFSLEKSAMTKGPLAEHFESYWLQSIVQATAADLLCDKGTTDAEGDPFLAGLLMDIGRLVLLTTSSETYLPVLVEAGNGPKDLHVVELQELGIDHVQIGTELMNRWNLPATMVEPIQSHHAPVDQLREQSGSTLTPALAVAASIGDYFCAPNKAAARERLKSLFGAFYSQSEWEPDSILEKTKTRIDEVGELFSVKPEQLPSLLELFGEANDQLAQLLVAESIANSQAQARADKFQQEKEQFERQALHDPLTKAYNRRFFEETLSKEISHCCRHAIPIGLLFIDIDTFKTLNDTYGHPFGDSVLKQLTNVFTSVLRDSDVLARYGGDEFFILANQPSEHGLNKLAGSIRAAVESETFTCKGKRVPVTISIGGTIALPARNDTGLSERLIVAADAAIYEAKRLGRNQVAFHSLVDEFDRHLMQRVIESCFSRWLVNRGALDGPTISSVMLRYQRKRCQIGELAVQYGYLSTDEVDQVMQEQNQHQERFGHTALQLGLLTQDQLVRLLAIQRENPTSIARIMSGMGLVDEIRAAELVSEYTKSLKKSVPA